MLFASPTRSPRGEDRLVGGGGGGGGGRKGSTPAMQPPQPLVQRSASFNASSTVPLKITILDEPSNESGSKRSSPYCVKTSKSLSNCSLISKIVSKSDGTRNIISHLVPTSHVSIDGSATAAAAGKTKGRRSVPNCDGVDKFRDYYV